MKTLPKTFSSATKTYHFISEKSTFFYKKYYFCIILQIHSPIVGNNAQRVPTPKQLIFGANLCYNNRRMVIIALRRAFSAPAVGHPVTTAVKCAMITARAVIADFCFAKLSKRDSDRCMYARYIVCRSRRCVHSPCGAHRGPHTADASSL